MADNDHIRSGASCADLLKNNPLFQFKTPLSEYLTRQPDELSMQCVALCRAAIDCDDSMYREVLLFALIERQICLAKALNALPEQDIGQFDNWLDKQIKLHHQQYKASCLPEGKIPTSQPPANQAHHLNNELLIKCHLSALTTPQKKQFIYELVKRYLRFMSADHMLSIALLINHSIEQWLASAPNSNKTMALKQSVKSLLKSYFKC